jgi:hypothetical protein
MSGSVGAPGRQRPGATRPLTEADSATETDELCSKVRTNIETASAELKDLQEKAGSVPPQQRKRMKRAIAGANEKLLVVRRTVRRIPSEHGPVWTSFREEVDREIDDLDEAIRTATEVRVASE